MKKELLLINFLLGFILILISGNISIAQSQFHKIYDHGPYPPPGNSSTLKLPDGSTLIYSRGGVTPTAFVARLSQSGIMLWSKRLFDDQTSAAVSVIDAKVDTTGHVVLALSGFYTTSDGYILRMDTLGIVDWSYKFDHGISAIVLTLDGHYAGVSAWDPSTSAMNSNIQFTKIAYDGTVLINNEQQVVWSQTGLATKIKMVLDMVQRQNGDYTIVFYSTANLVPVVITMDLDVNGNFKRIKGISELDIGFSYSTFYGNGNLWKLFPKNNGELILCGSNLGGLYNYDLLFFVQDSTGTITSSISYSHPDLWWLQDAVQMPDSSIYITARIGDWAPRDQGIIHLDKNGQHLNTYKIVPDVSWNDLSMGLSIHPNGDVDLISGDTTVWQHSIEIERLDTTFIQECNDSTTVLSITQGTATIAYNNDVAIVVGAPMPISQLPLIIDVPVATLPACLPTSTNEQEGLTGPRIFPNPTSGIVHLAGLNSTEQVSFELYNSRGSCVRTGTIEEGRINSEDHPSGLYLLLMQKPDGEPRSFRIVLE